jgi:hypothetical protein
MEMIKKLSGNCRAKKLEKLNEKFSRWNWAPVAYASNPSFIGV